MRQSSGIRMRRTRDLVKGFRTSLDEHKRIHQNVSLGYTIVKADGTREFVPYDKDELGEIHSFISPSRDRYKRMKWTKTHDWKDQTKAKKSTWKYTPVMRGLNTVSK